MHGRLLLVLSQIHALEENTQTASGKGPCGQELWPFANTHVNDPSQEWKPLGQSSLQMITALDDVLTITLCKTLSQNHSAKLLLNS